MQSSFDSYKQKCESLIPYCLFEEKYRKTIYIRILLCQSNEPYVLMFTRCLQVLQEKNTPLI